MFIFPSWMVTYPVLVSLIAQSYPVWLVVTGEGAGVGILRDGMISVTWLVMMPLPLSFRDLMLYLCFLGIWFGTSSNWCGSLLMISVLSGMMCGALCGVVLVTRPGFIKMESLCITLCVVFGCEAGGFILDGFYVTILCSGAGNLSTLVSCIGRYL